jgi:hypothetical protein
MYIALVFLAGCAAGAIGLLSTAVALGHAGIFDDSSRAEDQGQY